MSGDMPAPLSRTVNSSGRAIFSFARRLRHPEARTIAGREDNLTVYGVFANGFRGILDKIEEDLNQLVAMSQHSRERRIVCLNEPDMARDPGLGEALHVLKNLMHVDRLALDRAHVAEKVHAID